MDFTPETLRKRFHELCDQRDQIRQKAQPVRDEYDAISQKRDLELNPLRIKLKEIEAPLYNLDQEIATIARALGGKTGERTSNAGP